MKRFKLIKRGTLTYPITTSGAGYSLRKTIRDWYFPENWITWEYDGVLWDNINVELIIGNSLLSVISLTSPIDASMWILAEWKYLNPGFNPYGVCTTIGQIIIKQTDIL